METTVITIDYLTADGETYNITVTFGPDEDIPTGSVLSVREILPGTTEYEKYFNDTANNINGDLKIAFARFFDVSIMNGEEKIEPKDPVKVTINYAGRNDIADSASINVIHFADTGVEIIDKLNTEIDGTQIKTIEYAQTGFSVIGTIGVSGYTSVKDVIGGYFVMYAQQDGVPYALTHNYGETEVTTTNPYVLAGYNVDGAVTWEAEAAGDGYYLFYRDVDFSVVHYYLNVDEEGAFWATTKPHTRWTMSDGYLRFETASGFGYMALASDGLATTGSINNAAQMFFASVDTYVPGEMLLGASLKAAGPTRAAAGPATEKNLIDNGDGTYTIALSVTGEAESSSTTEVSKANVVLVIDTSNSMNGSSGTTAPYEYTPYTGSGGQGQYWGTDGDGEYYRVYWRNNAWRTGNQNWSPVYSGTVYTRSGGETISRIEAEKDALTKDGGIIDNLLAQNVAGDPVKSDIIEVGIVNFGTRGNTAQSPTTNAATLKSTINGLTTSTGTNWEEALQYAKTMADTFKANQPNEDVYVIFLTDGEPTTHNGSYNVNTNYATEWGYASDDARGLVTAGYTFYGLFTWGSGNSSHYLSSLVNYAYTGSGNSSSALAPAYAQYFTDASDTETLIDALNQIVHNITTGVGYIDVEMTDGVTAMTASNVKATAGGTVTGVKYYRSGGSYSTTANNGLGEEWTDAPQATINENGEVDWDIGHIVLEDGVTYTMAFVVWPKQESVDLVADLNNGIISYDELTPAQQEQIHVSGTHYTLKTNTDYPTVTYSTVTTTTIDGETTTVVSDPVTTNITNPDPVGLAESNLNAVKLWEDTLDPSQREEIEDVILKLKVDGHYYYVDEQGQAMGVTLTEESNWTITDFISIAPGLFVTEDSPAYDPTAPHFEWEGTQWAMLEVGHEYVFEEEDINNHFELISYTHHPMIMGTDASGNPIIKDVIFTKDASGNITGIESVSNMGDNLSATNILKGGVNLYKVVKDLDGNVVDSDDPFTITMHLKNPDGSDYAYDYRIYYCEKNPEYESHIRYNEDGSVRDSRSDHIYGTGTAEITIYSGDVVRFVNMDAGTLYYASEEDQGNYALESIAYKIAYGTNDESAATSYTEDQTVTIDGVTWYEIESNSAHYAVVTNKVPTAKIGIQKYGVTDTNPLSGVKFELYSSFDASDPSKNVKSKDATGTEIGTITTGNDGKAAIGRLLGGTYYLVETETNAGYNLLSSPVVINIIKDSSSATGFIVTFTQEGHNSSSTGQGSVTPDEDGIYEIVVYNDAGQALPNTGGPGTLFNYLGGFALLLTAVVMYGFRMRRRERRYN